MLPLDLRREITDTTRALPIDAFDSVALDEALLWRSHPMMN
jgi:hypothetical protein